MLICTLLPLAVYQTHFFLSCYSVFRRLLDRCSSVYLSHLIPMPLYFTWLLLPVLLRHGFKQLDSLTIAEKINNDVKCRRHGCPVHLYNLDFSCFVLILLLCYISVFWVRMYVTIQCKVFWWCICVVLNTTCIIISRSFYVTDIIMHKKIFNRKIRVMRFCGYSQDSCFMNMHESACFVLILTLLN